MKYYDQLHHRLPHAYAYLMDTTRDMTVVTAQRALKAAMVNLLAKKERGQEGSINLDVWESLTQEVAGLGDQLSLLRADLRVQRKSLAQNKALEPEVVSLFDAAVEELRQMEANAAVYRIMRTAFTSEEYLLLAGIDEHAVRGEACHMVRQPPLETAPLPYVTSGRARTSKMRPASNDNGQDLPSL